MRGIWRSPLRFASVLLKLFRGNPVEGFAKIRMGVLNPGRIDGF